MMQWQKKINHQINYQSLSLFFFNPLVLIEIITNFHNDTGKLALQALAVLPVDKRNFSGMTLGISRETYNEICEEIYNLRMKILNKAEADKNADMVYQLNFQFFPVTKATIERKNV